MFYIYILQSLKDGGTYTGYSKDVNDRLRRHNEGSVNATKYRRPLTLIFKESFNTQKEAKDRELWWKSGAGRRKMKELFYQQRRCQSSRSIP